jgi:COP9 signalosome complex subunit 1
VLCVDALKLAIAEAKAGRDVQQYRYVWEDIRRATPGEPEAHFDQEWADAMVKENNKETSVLEAELRGYKNNLVRESIRVRPSSQVS